MALIQEGRSLEAIKVYREAFGCSLLQALDAINNMKEGRDPGTPRPQPLPAERLYRFVGPRQGQEIRQFVAFPRKGRPVEEWGQLEMGWPRVLILGVYSDHATLYRYTADGNFAGDTWAATAEDAKAQATYEYGSSLEGPWLPIPEVVPIGMEQDWALRPSN
jgi:hypothetical protein